MPRSAYLIITEAEGSREVLFGRGLGRSLDPTHLEIFMHIYPIIQLNNSPRIGNPIQCSESSNDSEYFTGVSHVTWFLSAVFVVTSSRKRISNFGFAFNLSFVLM